MNYKMIGKFLVYQEAKGRQWFEVPYDELVRLALLGIRYESQLTKHTYKNDKGDNNETSQASAK